MNIQDFAKSKKLVIETKKVPSGVFLDKETSEKLRFVTKLKDETLTSVALYRTSCTKCKCFYTIKGYGLTEEESIKSCEESLKQALESKRGVYLSSPDGPKLD